MQGTEAVWEMAITLISDHGTNAEAVAAECLGIAERSREIGEVALWRSVVLAIEDFTRSEPEYDEWMN
jgi:hypothetical protein